MIAALLTGPYSWAEPAGAPSSIPTDGFSVVDFGNPLSGADLGGQNGRKDVQIGDIDIHVTEANLDGYLGENQLVLEGSTNGANSITGNAFSGASGIATVIQNSGNQVLIQNATIVDVTMK